MFARVNLTPCGVFIVRGSQIDVTDAELKAKSTDLPAGRAEAIEFGMHGMFQFMVAVQPAGSC